MSLLPIVRLGHPALRGVALALDPEGLGDAAVQALIDSLIETMRNAHGVGLAAPQVGVPLQIFVYEQAAQPAPAAEQAAVPPDPGPAEAGATAAAEAPAADAGAPSAGAASGAASGEAADGPPTIPLHTVINPMLTPLAGEMVYDWEGCLSIPELRGLVPRHPAVRVRGLDRHGRPLDYAAQGLEARIIQHEFDHLNGIVFLDRMRDLKTLACREEWERYMAPGASAGDEEGSSPPPPPSDEGSGAPPSEEGSGAPDPAVSGVPAARSGAAAV
jgi:peptide deformylase